MARKPCQSQGKFASRVLNSQGKICELIVARSTSLTVKRQLVSRRPRGHSFTVKSRRPRHM